MLVGVALAAPDPKFATSLVQITDLNPILFRENRPSALAIYSISDLEKLSGVKAHTIRAWEKRYGVIKPKRTKTNIRYYEDDDLKELLNIALLNKNGIKISKIARMNEQEKASRIAEVSSVTYQYDTRLDALTISTIELDEFKFNHIIDTNVQQHGFERTMLELIYPFLDKLSVLWFTGSINAVQERFVSNLIRAKLVAATDRLPRTTGATKYLLYLPPGEEQELSLLFMHYLLRAREQSAVYLGPGVEINDLRDAAVLLRPEFVFTILSETFVGRSVRSYLEELCAVFPSATLLATGYQVSAQGIEASEAIRPLKGLDDTLAFVDARRTVAV